MIDRKGGGTGVVAPELPAVSQAAQPLLTRFIRWPNLADMIRVKAGRNFSTLLAGALFAAPSLCAAGLITHACDWDCGPTSGQHNPDERGHGCGHESDCASDPCSLILMRTESQSNTLNVSLPLQVFALPSCCEACTSHSACIASLLGGERAGRYPRLPFPPSDVPLLI